MTNLYRCTFHPHTFLPGLICIKSTLVALQSEILDLCMRPLKCDLDINLQPHRELWSPASEIHQTLKKTSLRNPPASEIHRPQKSTGLRNPPASEIHHRQISTSLRNPLASEIHQPLVISTCTLRTCHITHHCSHSFQIRMWKNPQFSCPESLLHKLYISSVE